MKKFFYSVLAVAFAALTFTSCDDVPMPYAQPEVNGGGTTYEGAEGDGTLENPYNVAGVLQFISTLESGVESTEDVYISGKVVSIAESNGIVQNYDTSGYGSATFDITDGTNTFTIYRAYYLNNQKWTTGAGDPVKIGDDVIICGKVYLYNGKTPETVSNKAYLYKLNDKTSTGGGTVDPGTPSGEGTEASPFNVAAAIAKCKEIGTTASTESYYVKGIVDADATTNTQYNNITFDMVDAEGGEKFKAYQVTVLDGMTGVKKGDEVVVYGPIYNYSGNTPETAGKSAAKIVSYKNNSGSDTGGDTGGDTGANMTKSVDATNYIVTFTNSSATAGESVTYDLTTCGLTHQTENPSFTMNGANFVFATNGGKNTPKYWHDDEGKFNEFRMYALNTLTITGTANIAAVSFQCSPDYNGTKYTGNDDAFGTVNGKTFTFTNQWSSNSGGTQLRITKVTITYAK